MSAPMRLPALVRIMAMACLVLAAAACDDDPSGPGTFTVRVDGPADAPAGAAVVELAGEGITGFEAIGSAQVFSRTVRAPTEQEPEGLYRVVVVAPAGSSVAFGVEVEDVALGYPSASLRRVTDTANAPIQGVGDYRIRLGS